MTMMQAISSCTLIILLFSIIQVSSNDAVGKCLRDLATKELSLSYNYLQLSSKFGTTRAYPGFSSLFTKLSDDDSSKGHELVKFLALRKFKIDRLINNDGIKLESGTRNASDINKGLEAARHQNKDVWIEVVRCHQEADSANDANVQDYLESHLLDHHIEHDKLLSDIIHRIGEAKVSEMQLITYMVDDDLLHTYGDRRKDVFS